jgi:hypothetical protein
MTGFTNPAVDQVKVNGFASCKLHPKPEICGYYKWIQA